MTQDERHKRGRQTVLTRAARLHGTAALRLDDTDIAAGRLHHALQRARAMKSGRGGAARPHRPGRAAPQARRARGGHRRSDACLPARLLRRPALCYHWGLEAARAHLKALGASEPELHPFDPAVHEPMPGVHIGP